MSGPGAPNTPGVRGYLLAWLVSVLVFSLEVVVLSGEGIVDLLVGFVVIAGVTGLFSVPFAAIGVPVVHFSCRRVEAEAVHVLAAGTVGWVSFAALPLFNGDPWAALGGLVLGVPTALGRLAVVPLVSRRRRNWAAPALTG